MNEAQFEARNRKIWFIRKVLDDAMEGATDDDFSNPQRLFDTAGPHSMSVRIARAFERAGFMLSTEGQKPINVGGIRRRMLLEDVLDPILVWLGRKELSNARYNSQARDRFATAIFEGFHRRKLVLVRIRETGEPPKNRNTVRK